MRRPGGGTRRSIGVGDTLAETLRETVAETLRALYRTLAKDDDER
jgi:hypothetical protein